MAQGRANRRNAGNKYGELTLCLGGGREVATRESAPEPEPSSADPYFVVCRLLGRLYADTANDLLSSTMTSHAHFSKSELISFAEL